MEQLHISQVTQSCHISCHLGKKGAQGGRVRGWLWGGVRGMQLISAHLALQSLHRGSVPPVFQQLLLQFILLLRGVKVVHGHELVAELLQPEGWPHAVEAGPALPSHQSSKSKVQLSQSIQPLSGGWVSPEFSEKHCLLHHSSTTLRWNV